MAHILGPDFDRCSAPLSGEEPTGIDARYDENFVDLKAEIENIASGNADWEIVEKLSVKVLAETSKDLYTMSYLTAALIQRHGFLGLADGFALLRHWMENDWDNLHPVKPARSRGFAFSWLVERVTPYIEARVPQGKEEIEILEPLREDLHTIATLVREKLAHLAPGFGEMQEALRRKAEEHRPPPVEEPREEAASSPEPSSAVQKSDASGAATEENQPQEALPQEAATPQPKTPETSVLSPPPPSLQRTPIRQPIEIPDLPPLEDSANARDIRNRIRAFIGPLRQSGLLSPTPYRMLRVLKWQDLQAPPTPADPGGRKTKVPGPRTPQRRALANLYSNNNWLELLEASEAAFQDGSGTFWLDLHRYTALALENYDPTHGQRLAAVVIEELRTLLDRFSNLHHLSFSDGAPFASPETRQWIEESVRVVEVEPLGGGGRAEDNVLTEDELKEAKSLFDKKKTEDAMMVLQKAMERAGHPRAVFRTRLTTAQICIQAGKMTWARSLLEQLRRDIGAFRFETWEPEITAEVYHLLAICCARLLDAAGPEIDLSLEETLAEAQAQLFTLDLRAAARVEQLLGDKKPVSTSTSEEKSQARSSDILQLLKQLLGRV